MANVTYPHVPVTPGRCLWCGAETGFFKNGKAKKWCSDYCCTSASSFRTTGRIAPVPSERPERSSYCRGCGKELQKPKRQGNPRIWCSSSCRVRFYRLENPEYRERCAQSAKRRAAVEERRKPPRPRCKNCGKEMARKTTSQYCSAPPCRAESARNRRAMAPNCSKDGCDRAQVAKGLCVTHYARRWKKKNPERYRDGRARNNHLRRARMKNAFVEAVGFQYVLERDAWKCGICGKSIPKNATFPDPLSPSLDHIVPLALGGKHEKKNVQAAHLRCNSRKSSRGFGDQLLLLG